MGLKEGRVVDDEGQEHREGPQQQGGEELGDDRALNQSIQRQLSDLVAPEAQREGPRRCERQADRQTDRKTDTERETDI